MTGYLACKKCYSIKYVSNDPLWRCFVYRSM